MNPILHVTPKVSAPILPREPAAFSISAYKPLPPEALGRLRDVAAHVSGAYGDLVLTVPRGQEPSPELRQAWVDRLKLLTDFMTTPSTPHFIGESIGVLLIGHRQKHSPDELRVLIEDFYIPQLSPIPRAQLQWAFMQPFKFMPTPYDLIEKSKEFAPPWRQEIHLLNRVTKAEIKYVQKPEEFAGGAARAKELARLFAETVAAMDLKAQEKRSALANYASENQAGMSEFKRRYCDESGRLKVGPSLQEKLAKWAVEEAADHAAAVAHAEAEGMATAIADVPNRK